MKATLRFDLDDVDDRMAHLRCVKSLDMALLLWEVREVMQEIWKQTDDDDIKVSTDGELTPNGIRTRLTKSFEKYNIELEELTR